MPPFRKGFYQIVLKETYANVQVQIGPERLKPTGAFAMFHSPALVYVWQRALSLHGYLISFEGIG